MELRYKRFLLPTLSLALLLAAILAGLAASRMRSRHESTSMEVFESGIKSLKSITANALYLRIDDYHHLWMYQGHTWTTATDYLPMIWLVVTLRPDFVQAYVDGAYHLAVNLDQPREGLDLLRRGIRNSPRNLALYWERAVISWKADLETVGVREKEKAFWKYLGMVRRHRGDPESPWNESNALIGLSEIFETHSSRAHNRRISRLYDGHADRNASLRRFLNP
ncbi:hypothetical protein GF402_05220 [Candidatus Fermentibacteria bacterium]|nr:hypothetical protein [Candidatus Fermentibacteria bacterium]